MNIYEATTNVLKMVINSLRNGVKTQDILDWYNTEGLEMIRNSSPDQRRIKYG